MFDIPHPRERFLPEYAILVQAYESSLSKVYRFKNPQTPPLDNRFTENDLVHVNRGIVTFLDFCSKTQTLAGYLGEQGINRIILMFYLHEAGEIFSGDTPLSMEDWRQINSPGSRLVKKRFALDGIQNPTIDQIKIAFAQAEHDLLVEHGFPLIPLAIRALIWNHYFAFETPMPNDAQAALAKCFDVTDGNTTFYKEFANQNTKRGPVISRDKRDFFIESARKDFKRTCSIMQRTLNLFPASVAKPVANYFSTHIEDSFIAAGYQVDREALAQITRHVRS